jgi:hypothetical protein
VTRGVWFTKTLRTVLRAFGVAYLICVLVFGRVTCAAAFPIEEFKNFLSSRPTIENFEFKVRSVKFIDNDIGPDTYRSFSVAYENDLIYRLIEDRTGYVLKTQSESGKILIENSLPPICFTRYGTDFAMTFNSNDVVSTSYHSFDPNLMGPARISMEMIRIAYDVLNLGLTDMRTNQIVWSGSQLTCVSNENGSRVEGTLSVDESGVPKNLDYFLINADKKYRYLASYEFESSTSLPAFLPSRVTIDFVDSSGKKQLSDYRILNLAISHRNLGKADVSYSAFLDQKIRHYVYRDSSYYRVTTNLSGATQLKRLPSYSEFAMQAQPLSRRAIFFVLLFIISVPPILLLFKKKSITWGQGGVSPT